MSSLAARLADQKPKHRGGRCSVESILTELNDIDARALTDAIESHMQSSDIARALRLEGHDIAGNTVARHRRGDCSCDAG
jgi:hypothetical protein